MITTIKDYKNNNCTAEEYWTNPVNIKKEISRMLIRKKMRHSEFIKKLNSEFLTDNGLSKIAMYNGGLLNLIRKIYPDTNIYEFENLHKRDDDIYQAIEYIDKIRETELKVTKVTFVTKYLNSARAIKSTGNSNLIRILRTFPITTLRYNYMRMYNLEKIMTATQISDAYCHIRLCAESKLDILYRIAETIREEKVLSPSSLMRNFYYHLQSYGLLHRFGNIRVFKEYYNKRISQ